MPRPTSATTLSRPELKALVIEFLDRQEDYVGIKALPIFPVEEQASDYPVIPVEALLNVPDTKRTPRGGYPRGDYEFETDSYDCVENGWEEPVDEVEAKMYERYFDVEEVATLRAVGIILRTQEKRIADMLFNASTFTVHNITNEWDNNHYTDAIPIADVNTGRETIHDACGLEPNTLIIPYKTFHHLGLMDEILDKIKYTYSAEAWDKIGRKVLAEAFGLNQILIGKNMYNAAKKGQAVSLSPLWDDEYALLCCVSNSKDLTTPCMGRTFLWTKDSPENTMVESYRDETVRSDIIRVRQHTDEEIILVGAAYLLGNITT